MKGNVKIITLSILILIVLSVLFIFQKKRNSTSGENEMGSQNSGEDFKSFPLGIQGNDGSRMDSSIFESEQILNYNEFTEKLQSGEYSFIWELWKFRRLCPEDYKPAQCNELLLAHIDKTYSPPDNDQLKSLFKDYFRYESILRETEISPDLKFNEKYEIIRKKRQEIFKDEQAKLVFGMEEAQVEFLNTEKEFLDSSKKMKGDERVKAYDMMKKKTLGSYYEAIVSRQDPYQNYNLELSLRESDLNKLPPESRQASLNVIQEKYFGKDGAERIRKAIDEVQSNDNKIAEYEKKSQEFLSQNNGINEREKEEKLKELRIKILGEEEANAYTRRRDLEEELKKIQ